MTLFPLSSDSDETSRWGKVLALSFVVLCADRPLLLGGATNKSSLFWVSLGSSQADLFSADLVAIGDDALANACLRVLLLLESCSPALFCLRGGVICLT